MNSRLPLCMDFLLLLSVVPSTPAHLVIELDPLIDVAMVETLGSELEKKTHVLIAEMCVCVHLSLPSLP